ncbi:MAG: helix-turn-helix transcriptional regulator [Oscillospiraceae bacterium]|nr:helix-turn-helix transcriptional regulator [Oscillospiraceae bacterium]
MKTLIGVHMMINEHQRIKEQLLQLSTKNTPAAEEIISEADITEIKDQFIKGYSELTPKEKEVFDMYVAGCGTKEILAGLNIKENTLKYHNKNIYAKLGITSRKQLVAVYKQLCITQQLSDK